MTRFLSLKNLLQHLLFVASPDQIQSDSTQLVKEIEYAYSHQNLLPLVLSQSYQLCVQSTELRSWYFDWVYHLPFVENISLNFVHH